MSVKNELKVPVKVQYPNAQCGMNFISLLANATTVKNQIHVLDYAFNSWGHDYYSSAGTPDMKSQVFFTDTIESEDTRWPEIKKICHRGPVTPNARYKVGNPERKHIAVYILTRGDYYKWREKWLAEHPEDGPDTTKEEIKKSELEMLNDIIGQQPNDAQPRPASPREITDSDRRRAFFMNF